ARSAVARPRPRSDVVTSAPRRVSRPPTPAPMSPAAMIAIFISASPDSMAFAAIIARRGSLVAGVVAPYESAKRKPIKRGTGHHALRQCAAFGAGQANRDCRRVVPVSRRAGPRAILGVAARRTRRRRRGAGGTLDQELLLSSARADPGQIL